MKNYKQSVPSNMVSRVVSLSPELNQELVRLAQTKHVKLSLLINEVIEEGIPAWKNRPPICFVVRRVKPLAELTADDVPPGLEPEDVATDWPPYKF